MGLIVEEISTKKEDIMSHYTMVKTKLTDLDCIVQALQDMGFKKHMIEVSTDELLSMKGYHGDTRPQKANIRIKGSGWGSSQNYVGGASNDLGLQKQADGTYAFHISDYDNNKYNTKWQGQFLQHYGRNVVKKVATQNNLFVGSESVDNEGNIMLELHSNF